MPSVGSSVLARGVREEGSACFYSQKSGLSPPKARPVYSCAVRWEIPAACGSLGGDGTGAEEVSAGCSERLEKYIRFWFLCTTCKEISVLLFLWFNLILIGSYDFFCGFNLSKVSAYRGRVQLPGRLFALCGLSVFIDIASVSKRFYNE